MLSDLGNDDRITLCLTVDLLNHIRTGQDTVVIFQRIVRFQCADLIVPLIMAHLRKPCIQPVKYLPHITDNAAVHHEYFY